MSTNMGFADRGIRILVAAILIFAAFTYGPAMGSVLHWIALGVAAVFILTSLVGNCPLYSLIGLKTCRDC